MYSYSPFLAQTSIKTLGFPLPWSSPWVCIGFLLFFPRYEQSFLSFLVKWLVFPLGFIIQATPWFSCSCLHVKKGPKINITNMHAWKRKSGWPSNWNWAGKCTATKIPFVKVFLVWELRGLSPNFHINVSASDLYIPKIGPHISCSKIGRSIVEIIGDRHMNMEIRTVAAQVLSRNICFKFSVLLLCSVDVPFASSF